VWRNTPGVLNNQEAFRMNLIFPIWFILAAIFAYLAYMQWRLSQELLRTFHFRNRGNYLEMINFRNKKNHQMAAIGFFVAVFLSLVSMFLVVGKF
jgi:hypothetical protein